MFSYSHKALFLLFCFAPGAFSMGKPPGKDAILLSKVHSLTLRANRMTTSRRVSPVQQLTCVGPSASVCKLHSIETMRCTNEGYDYDEEDVQWTCTASLPSEFKLGSTDVICEGYRNSEDKWVLKGSCGVEYRLLLTEEGERRFGHVRDADRRRTVIPDDEPWGTLANYVFSAILFGILIFILIGLLTECFSSGHNQRRGNNRPGPWGWGGGGGGDDDDPRGPPPPYEYDSEYHFKPSNAGSTWRPGFWTGALTGSAAGYYMGRRSQSENPLYMWGSTPSTYNHYDPDEGSSGSAPPRFSSSSPSTGFGSTRRR